MPRSAPTPIRTALAVAALCAAACGLAPGARFGRAGVEDDRLRVRISADAVDLDPARAHTATERAVSRQLFSALVEGGAKPSLATSWDELPEHRLRLHLRAARFSDNTPLGAGEVVWSWRRALRASTGAVDLAPLAVIARGDALAHGTLLRIANDAVRGHPAPYAIFRDGPGDVVSDKPLAAGTAVRVIDTNERQPCCGVAVPLHASPDADAPATDALTAGEAAVVIGLREVAPRAHSKSAAPEVFLRLRAPGGAAGWAKASDVTTHVPAVGLVHVVDRGGVPPALRAGPDEDAPARTQLADDDVVEMVERGPDRCLVIDAKSGRTGWLPTKNLDDTVRERRWFLVTPIDDVDVRAWVAEPDLAFDPDLLDAHAIDAETLDVGLAAGVDVARALAAFTEPVMRAVPPRSVEEDGKNFADVAGGPTSGPFVLAAHEPGTRIVLTRAPISAERDRAGLATVELVVVARPITALHLYRAGELDVLPDGSLPPELAPTLARASDFIAGKDGGALVAPEVRGFDPQSLELRDVVIDRTHP